MSAAANIRTPKPGARSPGRPREFDPDVAVENALNCFWRKGSRATTRQLEQALGLSQSSIYNAFGSKQGLLELALDRYVQLSDEALVHPLQSAESGLDGIEGFFLAIKRFGGHKDRPGCVLINLMVEDGEDNKPVVERARRYRKRVRTALVDALRRAAEAGETHAEDIEGRADLLMCLALGLNVAIRGGGAPAEIERMLKSAIAHCQSWRRSSPC